MSDSLSTMRLVLVVLSGIVYWFGVLLQARRIRKHIGRSPNLKPGSLKEVLLWAGWSFVISGWIIQAFVVNTFQVFSVFPFLVHPLGFAVGGILLLAGYAGTLWCYSTIGDSWRIGIDRTEKTTLVQDGPYHLVRHPIYLFQIIILAGIFFLIPSFFSVLVLVVHLACVLIKAMDEEDYLLSVHGEQYRDYLLRTGRLIPPLKRLLMNKQE